MGRKSNGNDRRRFSAAIYRDKRLAQVFETVTHHFISLFFSFCSPVCAFYPCECYEGNGRSRFRICNRTGYGLFRGTNRSPTNYRSNEWVLAAASLTRNYRRNGKSFIAFKILLFLSLSLFFCSSVYILSFRFYIIVPSMDDSPCPYLSLAFRFRLDYPRL